MGKLTGKGKHRVKVGNHPHTNMISKPPTVRKVPMQDISNAFEIETSNLRQSCLHTDCYIKSSW